MIKYLDDKGLKTLSNSIKEYTKDFVKGSAMSEIIVVHTEEAVGITSDLEAYIDYLSEVSDTAKEAALERILKRIKYTDVTGESTLGREPESTDRFFLVAFTNDDKASNGASPIYEITLSIDKSSIIAWYCHATAPENGVPMFTLVNAPEGGGGEVSALGYYNGSFSNNSNLHYKLRWKQIGHLVDLNVLVYLQGVSASGAFNFVVPYETSGLPSPETFEEATAVISYNKTTCNLPKGIIVPMDCIMSNGDCFKQETSTSSGITSTYNDTMEVACQLQQAQTEFAVKVPTGSNICFAAGHIVYYTMKEL